MKGFWWLGDILCDPYDTGLTFLRPNFYLWGPKRSKIGWPHFWTAPYFLDYMQFSIVFSTPEISLVKKQHTYDLCIVFFFFSPVIKGLFPHRPQGHIFKVFCPNICERFHSMVFRKKIESFTHTPFFWQHLFKLSTPASQLGELLNQSQLISKYVHFQINWP